MVFFGKDLPLSSVSGAKTTDVVVLKQPLVRSTKPGNGAKGKKQREPHVHAHNTRISTRSRGHRSAQQHPHPQPQPQPRQATRKVVFLQTSAKRMMSRGTYTPPPAPHNTNDVYMNAQSEGGGGAAAGMGSDDVDIDHDIDSDSDSGAALISGEGDQEAEAPCSPRVGGGVTGTGPLALGVTTADRSPGFCSWEGNSLLED